MHNRKRAFHPRKRTGCITCKIRRVKCDEEKPSCNRCLSTGRKCDGYADTELPSPPTSTKPPFSETRRNVNIPMSLGLPLPRRNDQELRSYRFFLDVTASEFAGVFDADFWLIDIPRTCHSDPAIWHAVVSLGAAHQGYLTSRCSARVDSTSPFAVYQYNQAVKHLVHLPSSRSVPEERWRALIASVLFTYLCSIQGLHSQSGVHLAAAKSLLKELQHPKSQSKLDATRPNQLKALEYLKTSSVSYKAVLSIIASLELQSQALNNRNANEAPELLRDTDAYTAWRYYTAPNKTESSRICQHGKCVPCRATPENIARAGKAFQSLLDALILLSQCVRPDKAGTLGGADKAMENPVSQQQPYARAFHELDTALDMFVLDGSGDCLCFGPLTDQPASSMQHQNKAIDSLRVFRAVCRPLLDYLMGNSHANLRAHAVQLLDLADSVLGGEVRHERSDATQFLPSLSITQPVFVIAATGPTLALRRRAMALLRQYPRREGLWDSLFVAAFLETCLEHEIALFRDARGGATTGVEEVEAIPESCQVRWAVFRFTGAHTARMTMKTLAEWLGDEPGREVPLAW